MSLHHTIIPCLCVRKRYCLRSVVLIVLWSTFGACCREGRIISRYGDELGASGKTRRLSIHDGIDIEVCSPKAAILAAADGQVYGVEHNEISGSTVTVRTNFRHGPIVPKVLL